MDVLRSSRIAAIRGTLAIGASWGWVKRGDLLDACHGREVFRGGYSRTNHRHDLSSTLVRGSWGVSHVVCYTTRLECLMVLRVGSELAQQLKLVLSVTT